MPIDSKYRRIAVVSQVCAACNHLVRFDPHHRSVVHCGYSGKAKMMPMTTGHCPAGRWEADNLSSPVKVNVPEAEIESPKTLASIRGCGAGRAVVLVANGPGHRVADLGRLRGAANIDIASINRPDMRVWPSKFWFFCDEPVLSFPAAGDVPPIMELWKSYEGIMVNGPSVQTHKPGRIVVKPPRGGIAFSRSIDRDGARIGGTTTHFALQVLLWAGYDAIYIVGCDMNVDGDLYPWGSNPVVADASRRKRFSDEAKSMMTASQQMTDEERSKVIFATSLNKWPFIERFTKIDPEQLADHVISRFGAAKQVRPSPRVTLLTPTGGRPEAFALAEKYVARQDYAGEMRWVVVDDGQIETRTTMGQAVIRPKWRWKPGSNTHAKNMMALLAESRTQINFWIEDDDWYAPTWISSAVDRLMRDESLEMVGQAWAVYYNVRHRMWRPMANAQWASACATAFRSSTIPIWERQMDAYKAFDIKAWAAVKNKALFATGEVVGIKGMPGRTGAASGHVPSGMRPDLGLDKLRQLVGEDADLYARFFQELPEAARPLDAVQH